MTTCINHDLSLGIDALSMEVLDWFTLKTHQQKQSVLTRIAFRPGDFKQWASGLELCWVPGYIRADATAGRVFRSGKIQGKVVSWSGEGENNKGWWSSLRWAWRGHALLMRGTNQSKSLTYFAERKATEEFPISVRSGVGVTFFNRAAPNAHCGISADFPRSLSASLCCDIYRRWTASIAYCYSIFTASARFAGNVATKADSVFEVAGVVKIDRLFDFLGDGSSANLSWTAEGLAAGASLYFDSGAVKEEGTLGGMPVCLTLSALYPVGQPLGSVEGAVPPNPRPRLFIGLEVRPFMGTAAQSSYLLEKDPFYPPPEGAKGL